MHHKVCPIRILHEYIDICPKCSGEMKVISVIEDEEVIKKILRHLGLWDLKARSPTKSTFLRADTHRQAGPPKPLEYTFDYSTSQLPASDKCFICRRGVSLRGVGSPSRRPESYTD